MLAGIDDKLMTTHTKSFKIQPMNSLKNAFSLVELSIVLVILGLLTGGILGGQSLIRAAELRAVSTEYQRWVTATQTFRDKYFALPGDMTNATAFWGKDNAVCTGDSGTAATPGTCNGNGNGEFTAASGAGATGELYQYWKQMGLAGLIEGQYTGVAGPGGASEVVIGVTAPRSKLNNAGWSVWNGANYPGNTAAFASDYGQTLMFGTFNATQKTQGFAVKPEEAWNIDTKLDDGSPARGKIWAYNWPGCTTAASNTDYAASYRLDSSSIACALIFSRAL